MSEIIQNLSAWHFPDTHMEPDGYDMTSVIEATGRNIQLLVDEHNKLVDLVKELEQYSKR